MTERLAQLLAAEADRIEIPAPPTAAVLGRGRGLRRRRRAVQGVAGLAVLAVVGAGVVLVRQADDDRGAVLDPAAPTRTEAASGPGIVFSIGPTVYLDGATVSATVDDVVVKSMYYTSAGVLVRHGENSYSDEGGPQRFSLVTTDGTVKPLGVTTEEVVPGVDVTQPYLAYAVVVSGIVEVVVHDITTDEEVARVAVPDATQWGGWSAPPVSLDGDLVHVGTDDVARVVNWRNGDVIEDPTAAPGFPPQFAGGRTTRSTPTTQEVLDASSGDTLLSITTRRDDFAYLTLSPDGRFAKLAVQGDPGAANFQVYDVDTGAVIELDGDAASWGWSTDGDLFNLSDEGVVTSCSAETGTCSTEQPDLDVLPGSAPGEENFSDDVVLGNQIRES